MLSTILTLIGAVAQAAVPATAAAPAGRALKDMPNTTITYYDIAGRNGPAIAKSLKAVLAAPATKDATRLFVYDVNAQIMKATTGPKCTVTSAKATLTSTVHLPRLAEEAKVPKDVLTNWRTFVAGAESDAAANLWFVKDHLPSIEKSIVGLNCDQANPAWNAGLTKLKAELAEFGAQRAAAAKKPSVAPVDEKAKIPEEY